MPVIVCSWGVLGQLFPICSCKEFRDLIKMTIEHYEVMFNDHFNVKLSQWLRMLTVRTLNLIIVCR